MRLRSRGIFRRCGWRIRYGIKKVIETAHRFGVTSNAAGVSAGGDWGGGYYAGRAGGAYSVFPNDGIRIQPHYIRKVVQTDGLQVGAEDAGGEGSYFVDIGADDDDPAAGGGAAWHGCGCGVDEPCVWGQDGNDEQLYRCVVYRVFAVGDVRDVDWVSIIRADAGRKRDGSQRPRCRCGWIL